MRSMDAFLYRGNRNYIHSTSLCNYLQALHPEMSGFDLVIRKWMTRVPRCIAGTVEGAHASAKIVVDTLSYEYSFVESDERVSGAEDFSEDLMREELVHIDGQSMSLRSSPSHGFTFFDRSICGGKHLIEQVHAPATRLILARFTLIAAISDSMPFLIRAGSRLGKKLYKMSYHSESGRLGEALYYGE